MSPTMTASATPSGSRFGPVGLICRADHPTFGPVADRLETLGYDVEFFQPGVDLLPAEIDGLSLLLNKAVDPASFRALRYADRTGVPTWNGTVAHFLAARLVGVTALEAAGFDVPPVSFEPPDGPYVAKELFDWHDGAHPTVGGESNCYQELVAADPFDFTYYAVDDGTTTHVTCVLSRSELHGERELIGPVTPDPTVVAKLRRLLHLVDARALGVDIVISEGRNYAVDVTPAMSFEGADMVDAVTDSVVDCLRTAPPRLHVGL